MLRLKSSVRIPLCSKILGLLDLLYEFKIFDGKVIVSTFNQSSDWKIYYSHLNSETERKMKNLSFPVPNNMAGNLNNIKIFIYLQI